MATIQKVDLSSVASQSPRKALILKQLILLLSVLACFSEDGPPNNPITIPQIVVGKIGLEAFDLSPFVDRKVGVHQLPGMAIHLNADQQINSIFITYEGVSQSDVIEQVDKAYKELILLGNHRINQTERIVFIGNEALLICAWPAWYIVTHDKKKHGHYRPDGSRMVYAENSAEGPCVYGTNLVILNRNYLYPVKNQDGVFQSVYFHPPDKGDEKWSAPLVASPTTPRPDR